MKSGIITMLAVAMFIPGMVAAGPQQGSSELELFGKLNAGDTTTTITASLVYGYFLTPHINLNGGILASGQEVEGSDETISFGGSLGAKYLISPEVNSVYLAADAIIYNFDEASETLSAAAFLGYQNYIGDNTALFYEIGYSIGLDSEKGQDSVVGNVGITVYFD